MLRPRNFALIFFICELVDIILKSLQSQFLMDRFFISVSRKKMISNLDHVISNVIMISNDFYGFMQADNHLYVQPHCPILKVENLVED